MSILESQSHIETRRNGTDPGKARSGSVGTQLWHHQKQHHSTYYQPSAQNINIRLDKIDGIERN